MWSPPDPYEPTSQLYRLMPPRPDDGDPIIVISPDLGRWQRLTARVKPASRLVVGWAWGVVTGVLVVVIGSLVYGWLSGH